MTTAAREVLIRFGESVAGLLARELPPAVVAELEVGGYVRADRQAMRVVLTAAGRAACRGFAGPTIKPGAVLPSLLS